MKQLKMKFAKNYKKQFGGELLIGKRKTQRPLSTKKPIHLVLRSDTVKLFTPYNSSLEKLIYRTAGRFQIRVYDLALNWNHIHAVIMIKDRNDYVRFIRALTSLVSMKIKSKVKELKTVFSLRPFTRILDWGIDFKNTQYYVFQNQLEAFGCIKREKLQTILLHPYFSARYYSR